MEPEVPYAVKCKKHLTTRDGYLVPLQEEVQIIILCVYATYLIIKRSIENIAYAKCVTFSWNFRHC